MLSTLLSWQGDYIKTPTQTQISAVFSQERSDKPVTTKIIYTTDILTAEQKNTIEQTIKLYKIKMDEIVIADDDQEWTTLAHAEPWIIFLNSKVIKNISLDVLQNTIIHELFHAIKPPKATAIQNYVLSDLAFIEWFHGLSIVVQDNWQKTQFGILEDAAAETCASKFKSGYQVPNVYYANVGSLMLKMMHKWWFTIEDVVQAQQTNDVYSLVGKMLNISPSNKDVETIMKCFNDVYMTEQDLTNQAIKAIEDMRNK